MTRIRRSETAKASVPGPLPASAASVSEPGLPDASAAPERPLPRADVSPLSRAELGYGVLRLLRAEAKGPLAAAVARLDAGVVHGPRFLEGLCARGLQAAARPELAGPREVADVLLGLAPQAQTKLLREIEAPAPRRTVETGSARLALGRSVTAALAAEVLGKGELSGPLAALLERVGSASAPAWGALAEACGIATGAAFVAELGSSAPEDLDALAAYLGQAADTHAMLSEAGRVAARPVAGPELETLEAEPMASARLAHQARRIAAGFRGREPAEVEVDVRNRQRWAMHGLRGVRDGLKSCFGSARAQALFARIDLEAEVERLADPRHGARVFELEDPRSVATAIRPLEVALLREGLREQAAEALGALRGRPEAAALHRLFRERGPRSLPVREAQVALLERYLEPTGGTVEDRLKNLARAVRDPERRAAALADIGRDAEQLAPELGAYIADLDRARLAARQLERERGQVEAALDEGHFPWSDSTRAEAEASLRGAYPYEGLGYVAFDGAESRFFPVRNLLEGDAMGRDMGLDDPRDVALLDRLVTGFGWELLGKTHSHPDDDALISSGDLDGIRQEVALQPRFRTLILGIEEDRARWGSFQTSADGRLVREDHA